MYLLTVLWVLVPMSENVKIISEGYHSVNPYLVVRHADRAIEFYKKAFGAEEREE